MIDKNWCVNFLKGAEDGQQAHEDDKQNFLASVKLAHSEGFYLVYNSSRREWKLSNKFPEKVQEQASNLHDLVNHLFKPNCDCDSNDAECLH